MGKRVLRWFFVVVLGTFALVSLTQISHAQAQGITVIDVPPALFNKVKDYGVVTRPNATAYSVWTMDRNRTHQVWVRIAGGEALHRQRLKIYKENARPRPTDTLPPLDTLVTEVRSNTPTGWYVLDAERDIFTYYLDGDHRQEGTSIWDNAKGVRVWQTSYENGEFYRLGFEDIPDLDDYDDLMVEVAMVLE